eukprot:7294827-Alexandrium_andersonii.AAC.1
MFNPTPSNESFLQERVGRPYQRTANMIARPWLGQVPCESTRASCRRVIHFVVGPRSGRGQEDHGGKQ